MKSDQATLPAAAARAQAVAPPSPPPTLAAVLARADVRFNGGRPWDVQVKHPRLYRRLLTQWSLGAGEAYMDGDWDCEQLDELFTRLLRADLDRAALGWGRLGLAWEALRHGVLNLQSVARAFQVGERHYDVGNDVFEAMLDPTLTYSCAYWANADTLAQAQFDKLEMICRKLQLQPGERLLDIGCGWGGLARHAAARFGVQVTGVTVSREQLALAQARCAGLPVDLRLQDYRALEGRFDKIVSVGMFEHVGAKNYGVFFDTARRLLDPQGLFLLHTIGNERTSACTDPWIDSYVFPNGKIPSARELAEAAEGRFVLEDWHNFGPDYDRTLMAWSQRFEAAWPRLAARYDERFHRLWRYYLLSCAGFFRARQGQLWQLVLSPRGRGAAYRSWRPAGDAVSARRSA
jgi:cyclopropane-fatty-acyl-phospholipid synthase